MKERPHTYFYVGTTRPSHELGKDDWGVKHLYLHDDFHKACQQRNVFNEKPLRKPGAPRYRVYRLSFTEVV
jgi:hypothetical protein